MSGMQVKKYFEKKVSLLSTSDVRYDGELYTVDPSEQSIALKHVNCMGTEGRRSGDQAIAPSDCTYEFIIFRAVNIRELWLDEGNGHRRDLTNEILNPLRSGQNVDNYSKQRDMYDHDAPKRKVGYQSRSQQQGYDAYYGGGGGGYDAYYGGGGSRGGGYGPPAQQRYDQRRGYGAPPPPQQTYYDTPNQNNYYGRQGGYSRGQYGAPPPQLPPPSYNQRQQRRQPQYYSQQQQRPPQYYSQGYGQQQQQRRYQNQQRGYGSRGYSQNRGYQTGRYNTQRGSTRTNTRDKPEQAGTGAFLDSRRLRGDEIDIKDAQDFDFGAAVMVKDETQPNGVNPNAPPPNEPTEAIEAAVEDKENVNVEANAAEDDVGGGGDEDETKEDILKKYDKNKSFFDGLPTETKKSKPKQDLQQQKDVDTKTFGSVAATYKSRHINRQNQRYRNNRGYNTGQNTYNNRQRGYGYNNQQRGYNQYNNRQTQYNQYQSQATANANNYTTSKWVRR